MLEKGIKGGLVIVINTFTLPLIRFTLLHGTSFTKLHPARVTSCAHCWTLVTPSILPNSVAKYIYYSTLHFKVFMTYYKIIKQCVHSCIFIQYMNTIIQFVTISSKMDLRGGDVYYEHFIHGKEEEKQFIFEDHPYTIFLGPKSRVY